MKAVYMILSGLILSIGVTVAMAGLLSISSLTKSNTNKNTEAQEQFTGMWVTKDDQSHEGVFANDYDETTETDIYKDCYALNNSQINKERDNKKRQSN